MSINEISSGVPAYRVRQWEEGVARRVKQMAAQGTAPAQTLRLIAEEREALAAALGDPALAEAFHTAYRQELLRLAPAALLPDEDCRAQIAEVLQHRITDARTLAALVGDAAFIARVEAATPAPERSALPAEKIQEMIARLMLSPPPYAIDAAIHRHQSMEGQRLGHLALAHAFSNGALTRPLENALQQHWANASPEAIKALAKDWLDARTRAASATAEALSPGGAVYQAVLAAPLAMPSPPPTGLSARLAASTMLSPAEQEAAKTRQQKAEDVIYTLNHALTCLGITDTIVQPAVAALSLRLLGKRIDLCGHLPQTHEHHDHAHHDHAHHDHGHGILGAFRSWHTFKEFMIGELAGDVGAVVPTLALQRFAPGFMHGIRRAMEPLVGSWFRSSAERGARHWAQKHGLAETSPEVEARAQELYEYEVSHLPQMAAWTVSSIGINYGVMKFRNPGMKLTDFLAVKSLGSLVTAGLVLGARAASPTLAHGWDETVSRNLIVPATKILGTPFGVQAEHVDAVIARREGTGAPELQGRVAEVAPAAARTAT